MKPPRELPELLTPDEVAAWLKTTRKAVYAKAERGALPGATYVGRRLYFIRSDLLRCVAQGRVPEMGTHHGGTSDPR
jgi:hypothetical protein